MSKYSGLNTEANDQDPVVVVEVDLNQHFLWLKKPDGTFAKTLFVSEYLSYGGYNHPEICPDWS